MEMICPDCGEELGENEDKTIFCPRCPLLESEKIPKKLSILKNMKKITKEFGILTCKDSIELYDILNKLNNRYSKGFYDVFKIIQITETIKGYTVIWYYEIDENKKYEI